MINCLLIAASSQPNAARSVGGGSSSMVLKSSSGTMNHSLNGLLEVLETTQWAAYKQVAFNPLTIVWRILLSLSQLLHSVGCQQRRWCHHALLGHPLTACHPQGPSLLHPLQRLQVNVPRCAQVLLTHLPHSEQTDSESTQVCDSVDVDLNHH